MDSTQHFVVVSKPLQINIDRIHAGRHIEQTLQRSKLVIHFRINIAGLLIGDNSRNSESEY